MTTQWFAYGFKSFDAAHSALEHAFADGQIDHTTKPEIKSYRNRKSGKRFWGIEETLRV